MLKDIGKQVYFKQRKGIFCFNKQKKLKKFIPGVNACVKYMIHNWHHLKYIREAPKTFASFRKQGDDKRDWHFHHVF